jgi:hypothetical protein
MELVAFLTYLSGVGVCVAASFVLERIAWYQALEPNVKDNVFFGVCAVVALSAQAVLMFVPVEVLNQIGPWFLTVSTLFSYLYLGKTFHKVDKKEKTVDAAYEGLVDYE